VTAFFIPGVGDDTQLLEHAYAGMRRQIEADLGRLPNPRRILRLWTRRGRLDCITEVGRRDPLRGGTVMAIFDLGSRQPFVVWWKPDGVTDGVREVLGPSAYSVLEFDR
jgi:hypothetical protein